MSQVVLVRTRALIYAVIIVAFILSYGQVCSWRFVSYSGWDTKQCAALFDKLEISGSALILVP